MYTEELIDWKLMKCKRKVNAVLETIDFVDEVDGSVIFRTCEAERGKVNKSYPCCTKLPLCNVIKNFR